VMDGIDATRAIRAGKAGPENIHIPIVALTAHAMDGDRERFLSAGMDAYVAKPFKASDLIGTLMRCLVGRETGRKLKSNVLQENGSEESLDGNDGSDVIDEVAALDLLDGDQELLYEIWQDFLDEAGNFDTAIREAVSSGEHAVLEREAHSVKSSAGSIGARKLQELAFKIERAAHEGNTNECEDLYINFHEEFGKVLKALRLKCPGKAGEKHGGSE